jgi:hypothetical protein
MLLFLLLLIAAYVITGFYVAQNSTATQDVNLFGWHWTGIHVWYPVAAAAIAIGVLFVLYMMYAGLIHGVRAGSLRRRVVTHESTIGDLRGENTRLREENARLRGQLRGGTATGVPAGTTATPYQQPVGPGYAPGTQQPTGTPSGTTATTPPGRTTTNAAYRPRLTFGQRVRGFFGGSREPSGY